MTINRACVYTQKGTIMETNVNFNATLNPEATTMETPVTTSVTTSVKDFFSSDSVGYVIAFGLGVGAAKVVPGAYRWLKRKITK